MKANELRHGNFVKAKGVDHIFQFMWPIHKDLINEEQLEFYLKAIEPVPLTGEWLLKFGFVKGKEVRTNDYDTYTPYFLKRYDGMERIFEVRSCGSAYGICSPWEFYNYKNKQCYGSSPHIDYCVHSFQNLYFALTGKELSDETK